ncbi:hypothetical protein NQ315_005346 [Exocentrus adspersus]|uniref:BRCT domain-containing protein n=1 Tax=Exocentrus adspersus TaxID=1586481 RepID=A0AAV8W1Y6_9CUCU|nr:hypothetical protein NQ315_005346 [Exocentrus adspersus]
MDNIRLIFVLPEKYDTEKEVSEIMIQAYETCKQNVRTDVTWVKEDNFDSLTVNKTDFVIFEDFKGDLFENLKETKCARILGPWAISICLMDEKPIPNYPWPIYNVAMYECIIACSNLPKIKKLEIKERVEIMGGCYVDTLVEKVTHLITDSPKSEKYYAAAEAGVKLMCSSWIEAVWETSQSTNVHANDKEFEEHKCLPFQNLNICCTGLLDVQRKELERVIKKNGGKYSAKLRLTEADFLVCAGVEGSMSEKYKAARKRSNIYCVDISWVTESVAKGYSLPHHLFPVKKATSTPTKGGQYLNPDFSILSAISIANISSEKAGVDSTVNATLRNSPAGFASPKPGPSKRKGNLKEDYGQLVDSLDIKKAKKAGQYLDGCSVYITGFSPDHAEKLCKILNLSGATRYDQFSERVTHVIVGDPKFYEVKLIQSKHSQCAVVSVEWLLDSIEKLQPVSEEQYLLSISDINKTDFTSPLSKKGLNLLRTDRTVTRVEAEEAQTAVSQEEDKAETDIIQQYLKRGNTVQEEDDTLAQLLKNADNLSDLANKVQDQPKEPVEFKPAETSTQRTSMSLTQDETSASQMFFEGLKFLVTGFEENHFEYMRDIIEGSCGDVVSKNYKGIPDFVVVPVFNQCELRYTATEIVNDLFINECAKEGGLLSDICYYHRPLNLPDATPLENCVITISGYSSYERNFLKILIEGLGGRHQEQFSRVTSHSRAVVASTHLISDKPSGKKYQAALKWGLPVLTKDWLLECAKTGTRVSEDDHVVEDNNDSPSENIPLIDRKSSCATPKNNISNAGASASKVDSVTSTSAATPSSAAEQVNTFSAMSCLEKINTPGTPVDMQRPRSSGILTPLNQRFPRTLHFSDSAVCLGHKKEKPFSQATPVNKILQQYRESNAELSPCRDTPEKFLWEGIKTPDTPLGACICDPPSPNLRKQCELWLRQFPDFKPPPRYRRLSTPLSEIKKAAVG